MRGAKYGKYTCFLCKKIWKNLRSQHLREICEVRNSRKSGAGINELYSPKLWCFSQLQLLEQHTQMRRGESNYEDPSTSGSRKSIQNLSPATTTQPIVAEQIIDITTEMMNNVKEKQKKRGKSTALIKVRQDLAAVREKIAERHNKPFSWLGNLVSAKMDEIVPQMQEDAAWEVQCLMRRLVQESYTHCDSQLQSPQNDLLKNAMSGIFEDEVFENLTD